MALRDVPLQRTVRPMSRAASREILALWLLEHGVLVLEAGEVCDVTVGVGAEDVVVGLRLEGRELERVRRAVCERLAEEAARILAQRRRGRERSS